ncbi:MAG TPA: YbdD/YjiX family protein [Gemmatimonadaceae bacterium]|nr:YbdD/YjiX family protein [Gemmatimonadaceae bacterium]
MRALAPLRARLRAVGEITRRIIGVPDYERYAAHMRRHHPDQQPLPRHEFARQRLDEKYAKPGSRCC